MALTEFQRYVCRLIAVHRVTSGESYVAGAAALNELLGASRLSRDIDLFHDAEAAVADAWSADREIQALAFSGPVPDAGQLSRTWHAVLEEARRVVGLLPVEEAGSCVLGTDAELYRGGDAELRDGLREGAIAFHHGRIRGALPQVVVREKPSTGRDE